MHVYVGTSGYNYPEWRGSFYPEKFSTDKMLAYYAERFRTVEINYTFYRMPTEKLLAGWAAGTPERLLVHAEGAAADHPRLEAAALRGAAPVVLPHRRRRSGRSSATLLFQLPPTFKKDAAVLRAFLELLPDGTRAAFEFRHASWFDEEIYERLRARNIALCVADSEKLSTPVEITADYGYFRLRDEGYQQADIERWADVGRGAARVSRRVRLLQARRAGAGTGFRAALHRAASGCGSRDLIRVDMRRCWTRERMAESWRLRADS